MDLEKILKNAELEYGENIELVFYRDGSGHYPCELELKFG
jgi:hypothetical protein